MRTTTNILTLTALLAIFALSSCVRKEVESGLYEKHIDLANNALDRTDTTRARLHVDSAEMFITEEYQHNEILAYNILFNPHLSRRNLQTALASLDTLSENDDIDERVKMRLLEEYAVQLAMENNRHGVEEALNIASDIAHRNGEGASFVRINVRSHKVDEILGNYVDAVNAYKKLLDYARKSGLRSSEMQVLYRLVNAFLSMGDIPTAQIYQGEMSVVGDTAAFSQCLRYIALSRVCISIADTAGLRKALKTTAMEFQRDTAGCRSIEFTFRLMTGYYFLLTGRTEEAAEIVGGIKDDLLTPNPLTSNYIDLFKIQLLIKEGKLFEAKVMLDALDAVNLRNKNVEMYEQYTEAVSRYYSLIGDDQMAYFFLKQKTMLIDTLKRQADYNDLAYRSMELRRDTTIISQGHLLEQMADKEHRIETVRTLWFVIAIFIISEVIGLNFFISIRRIKKKRQELQEAYANMTLAIKRKKELLQAQKEQLDEQNDDLASELMFANHIQSNILQPEDMLDIRGIDGHFIIFSPCNMVSGDFYWFFDCGDKLFVCVADATGHGIPGAFISMVASTLLSDIASDPMLREPSRFVEKLSEEISRVIHCNTDIANKDSIDLSLFCLDRVAGKVSLCLSRQTAYIVRNDGTLQMVAGVRRSVGEDASVGGGRPFVTVDLNLSRGDCVYLTTDGFASQFGGPNNKKFKRRRLANMLLDCYSQRMSIQRDLIVRRFDDWRGENEQTDDVLMIGLKMGDLKSSRFSRFNNNPYHLGHGDYIDTPADCPPELVANVKGLLARVANMMATPVEQRRIVDVLQLFGECYIEWIDSKVRVTPAEDEWPSFALAEISIDRSLVDFTESVTLVVVTVPLWAKDLTAENDHVALTSEIEKDTVRVSFLHKDLTVKQLPQDEI